MMSTKRYRIRLTTDEQQELNALVSRGRAAAYKQTHARILLMSDESRSDGGMKDADITSALGVGQSTVERIRKLDACTHVVDSYDSHCPRLFRFRPSFRDLRMSGI